MAATERLNTIKKHLQGSDPGDSGAGDGSNATENGSCPAASFSAQTTIPRRRYVRTKALAPASESAPDGREPSSRFLFLFVAVTLRTETEVQINAL